MTHELYDDPRITAMGLLTEAYAGVSGRLAAQYAEHGLSAVEFEVLIRLSRSPSQQLRMTDLAAQTSLSTSGVTRVVDRLERDGLVRRTACPTDRRSSYTVLTRSGQTRLSQVLPGHIELIDQWFTGLLPGDRLGEMLEALRTIRDAVRPEATAGAASAEPDASPVTGRSRGR